MTGTWISPEYKAYLASPEWDRLARKVKLRAGFRCECVRGGCHGPGRCGARGILQANHLTYVRIFHEALTDLEAVCVPCHERYTARTRAKRARRPRRPTPAVRTSWWRRLMQ